jgi:murein DD-endopeptidase MepM/ murein hydrolase activator NlpD
LSRICAGHAFAITTQGDDFHGFEYEISAAEKLRILKAEEGFQVERAPIEYDVRTERVSGVITSNLYAAVDAAGESPELAVRLAEIFAWDIDFIRDIREGDTFTVLAEKRSRDGQPAGYGRILAAMFINQGQVYKGFLFETAEGQAHFYDENGRSMRKAFLKTPLDFARITSGFSRKRFHPVLGVNRPHLGTDYAAPTGTPIKSVGDGVITVLTRNNASGNYITIRHNNSYETSYLHMSRFASGLKRGSRVRQGQVIGYVGQTGWATGPHVCFRMKKNGQHINPVKLKTPPAEGVPQDRREAFAVLVSRLTTTLEQDASHTAEAQHQAVPAL